MDVDTIKLVLFICYITLLVIVALVWFRLVHTPNGELYRKVRLQGGYMPMTDEDGAGDAGTDRTRPLTQGALVQS